MVTSTVSRLSVALKKADRPIFGICLGHQLLALAAGPDPQDETRSQVDATSPARTTVSRSTPPPPTGWKELFRNADDGSNEGIYCEDKPFFSVQFHPESTPGPRDTEFLFDTLSDSDYNMLRTTAINVIRHLGVVGECNIQYALNPASQEYCIIEPSLDYVVVKIPRWDLSKFTRVSRLLSSSMKSVGEVMSIGRTFEETFQKAIRAIDDQFAGFAKNTLVKDIDEELVNPTDKQVFAISTAFHRGYSVDKIWQMTNIDKWFLTKLENIFNMENACPCHLHGIDGACCPCLHQETGIAPFVKQIDTGRRRVPTFTNYLYTTYNAIEHDVTFDDRGIMVLGSGVYRIGSSVEFDWCAIRAIRTPPRPGPPDDYGQLQPGDHAEQHRAPLYRQNVKIYGTSPEMVDKAGKSIQAWTQPLWKELTSFDEAEEFCAKVGYPVLVRPSYVLSGAAMNVVSTGDDLSNYLTQAIAVLRDHPSSSQMQENYSSPVADLSALRDLSGTSAHLSRSLCDSTQVELFLDLSPWGHSSSK
ncbi:hypothetical protein K438DRAFT_1766444 [Mycena galopus ATCC 62051]|nr:hypothetical protein K438DRAFT_1766444 [Mycena galopus ATCC 62051]